jgi:hypothetical protein
MKFVLFAIYMGTFAFKVAGGPHSFTKRSNYPNSSMKSLQCPNSNEFELSCLMIHSQSWPKNDIECGVGLFETINARCVRQGRNVHLFWSFFNSSKLFTSMLYKLSPVPSPAKLTRLSRKLLPLPPAFARLVTVNLYTKSRMVCEPSSNINLIQMK